EGGGATGAAAVAAFMSLPERWRAVLWHTEIEDAAPAAVASLFGLGAADTADLVARARDGMAQSAGIEPGGVHAVLRHAVAPAVLGAGAAGYLTELAYNPPAGPAEPSPHIGRPDHGPAGADLAEPSLAGPAGALVLGAPVAGAELAGPTATAAGSRASAVPGGHRAAGGVGLLGLTFGRAADWWRQAPARKRNLVAEVGVALMVAAIVGFALSLGPDSGRATAAPSRFAAAPRTVAPSSSPPPAPSATPSTTPPAVPPPAMISSSEPSQALPPAARLVASLTVAGPAPFSPIASVNFSVTDAGHVPTGNITAAISLPSTMGLEGSAQVGGWSCVMTGFTAICSHVPLPAGASTADFLTVALNSPSACGKLIELTVTTRSASTSASATIHCSGRHSRASIHRR
ncbi:MAG TPA: hypothetical protein VK586_13010, partial [Streptosporangiaceae bacterium]|nr:hypothetical protein [Streptosporangiaceae bacterium]